MALGPCWYPGVIFADVAEVEDAEKSMRVQRPGMPYNHAEELGLAEIMYLLFTAALPHSAA
eukprot:scaffold255043_cov22-Tisochrysis_lutea.AAC.1